MGKSTRERLLTEDIISGGYTQDIDCHKAETVYSTAVEGWFTVAI